MQCDLQDEIERAEQDLARGDFIDLTVEGLDACIAAGALLEGPRSALSRSKPIWFCTVE